MTKRTPEMQAVHQVPKHRARVIQPCASERLQREELTRLGDNEVHATLRPMDILAKAPLVLFCFGGSIKGSRFLAGIPFDITLAFAAILVIQLTRRATQKGARSAPLSGEFRLVVALLLAGAMAAWAYGGTASHSYVTLKLSQVFILAPLAATSAWLLIRTRSDVRALLGATVGFALLALGLTVLDPAGGRLSMAGGSTIGLARALGAGVVICIVSSTSSSLRPNARVAYLGCGALLAAGTLLSASRGPLFAAGAGIAIAAVARTAGHGRVKDLVAPALILGTAVSALSAGVGAARVTELDDTSTEMRLQLWSQAIKASGDNPLGVGWGRLYDVLGYAALDSGFVQYPHNLILEVAVEAGWATAALTITLLFLAWRMQSTAARRSHEEAVMLGLFAFHIANAMVSGDIGANRGLWLAVGVAAAARARV